MPLVRYSGFTLIAINLLPLAGVLFWDWSVFHIMIVYWLENVIIGMVNVLKMLTVLILRREWGMVFLIPFFCVHYGGFALGHGIFVTVLFHPDTFIQEDGSIVTSDRTGETPGSDPFDMERLLNDLAMMENLKFAVAALFASHVLSWWFNFVRAGEYRTKEPGALMGEPYGRVMLLHVTIIFGGFIVMSTGAKAGALVLLVLLKTAADFMIHTSRHEKAQGRADKDVIEKIPGALRSLRGAAEKDTEHG